MKRLILSLSLVLPALAQIATPEQNQILTLLAHSMSTMHFDTASPVTVTGRVSTLVWPEGTSGVILIQTNDGKRYAFSTAGVPAMAKQGFSRFTVSPGKDVTVVGLLAPTAATTSPGYIAARAETISGSDGKVLFDRAKLPVKGQ